MIELTQPLPWYRQIWPWALIGIPGVSVIAGMVMLTLAINGADSLVVDDYYKQGKAINQRIARDQVAANLGLTAQVRADPAGIRLRLFADQFTPPALLTGRLVHIAKASLDESLAFVRTPDGDYLATTAWPDHGHWRLHIEEPAGQWRLVSEKWRAGASVQLVIRPRAELMDGASN